MAEFCSNQQGKIKDTLKEEKRAIAEEGKYTLQRKLDSIGATMNTANLEELSQFYKTGSSLDLLYDIAVKKIDLKELKEFTVHGDKLVPPKPVKPAQEEKNDKDSQTKQYNKKDAELIIFGESSDMIQY